MFLSSKGQRHLTSANQGREVSLKLKKERKTVRKITKQARDAWDKALPFKKGNTEVRVIKHEFKPLEIQLLLLGNKIAWKFETFQPAPFNAGCAPRRAESLFINLCGWLTSTTKERLKAVGVLLTSKKGQATLHLMSKSYEISSYLCEEIPSEETRVF